jgi:hypothetical protein
MIKLVLLGCATLTFGVLAGVINGLSTRRYRRRLQQRPSPVLHPLRHHVHHRIREPHAWRPVRHAGLFLGFLLAKYVGLLWLSAAFHAVVD